jgi:GT2 family glycosyltransferase
MVREHFRWARLVENVENVGFGRAANQAFAQADTPWLVAANADIQVLPCAIEELVKHAEVLPEAGVIAPRLRRPDGRVQESVFPFPRVSSTLLAALGAHRLGLGHTNYSKQLQSINEDGTLEAEWAMGAFLLLRRDAFAAIGGFEESQWMYAEDLDLCWRMRKAGWKTTYVSSVVVIHAGGAATTQAFGAPSGTPEILTAYFKWLRRRRGRRVLWTAFTLTTVGLVARIILYRAISVLPISRAADARRQAGHWLDINLKAFSQAASEF